MKLIIAAMTSEVEHILKEFPFVQIDKEKNIYKHEHNDVVLALTGIGKVNAAFQLSRVLLTYDIDEVYNIGLAGATHHFKQGQCVLIHQAQYHDVDVTAFDYLPGQIPGCPAFFKTDSNLLKKGEDILKIDKAPLFTGDCFMTKPQEKEMVFDMEGAALYHVCYMMKKPIISIKVISDIIATSDHIKSYESFERHQGGVLLLDVFKKMIKEE